jgi:hypothetical protein
MSSDLQVTQTLDRSYYTGLESTKERDYDQVVYRHTLSQREAWEKAAVDQRKGREKHEPDSQQRRRAHPEKSRVRSGWNPSQTGKEMSSGRDENPSTFAELETRSIDRNIRLPTLTGPFDPRTDGMVTQDQGPAVSLLMVQHLWMWMIDESKHREPFHVIGIDSYRDNNYCVSGQVLRRQGSSFKRLTPKRSY